MNFRKGSKVRTVGCWLDKDGNGTEGTVLRINKLKTSDNQIIGEVAYLEIETLFNKETIKIEIPVSVYDLEKR